MCYQCHEKFRLFFFRGSRPYSYNQLKFKIAPSACQNMKVIKEVISLAPCKFLGQGKLFQFLKSAIVIFIEYPCH